MSGSRESSLAQPGAFVAPFGDGDQGIVVPDSRVIVKQRPSAINAARRRSESPPAYPTEEEEPAPALPAAMARALPTPPPPQQQQQKSPERVQHAPPPEILARAAPAMNQARSAPATEAAGHVDPVQKARELAEALKREEARKEKAGFNALRLLEKQCACPIPVRRLKDCHACDYCLTFDSAKTRDAYFVQVVDGLSAIAMHSTAPGAELLVVPLPPRSSDGKRNKKIKNALFSLEAVFVSSKVTSLHISVQDAVEEVFYQTQIERLNAMSERVRTMGSLYNEAPAVNAPFPAVARELVESQKKRILSGVVDQLIYGEAKVPADAGDMTLFPAHVDDIRDAIWANTPVLNVLKIAADVNEDAIRDYFGEETCFYFAWMNHYKRWLGAAGLLGLFVTLVGGSSQIKSSNGNQRDVLGSLDPSYNPFTLVFTAVMVVGSVLCVKTWERRCRTIAMRYEMYVPVTRAEERHEFKGTTGTDPITGESRRMYPTWKRALVLQPLSWCIIALFIFAVTGVLLAFLNLDGLVPSPDSFGAMPLLQRFSRRGGILNKIDHPWLGRIPTTAYSIVISLLSAQFRGLAEKLTNMENYRFRGEYVRALTQKRVVFELFNSYGKLLYIAFVRRSMAELSYHLKFIFFMGVFMRLFMGTLLPFLLTHRAKLTDSAKEHHAAAKREKNNKKAKKAEGTVANVSEEDDQEGGDDREGDKAQGGELQQHGGSSDSALDAADELLEPYEVYSDYIEMAIQFGYITLFAAVFPLAAFIALLSNFVEVRSDLFKLCYVARRPIPRLGVQENEAWIGVMRVVACMAVVTNTLLLFFTSSTMMHVFPGSYKSAIVTPNEAYAMVAVPRAGNVSKIVPMESVMPMNGTATMATATLNHTHNISTFVSMEVSEDDVNATDNATKGSQKRASPTSSASTKPMQSKYMDVQRVQLVAGGGGQQLIVIAVITEHVVLAFATFLFWRISSFPRRVEIYLAKCSHDQTALKIKSD